jgi:hypothetical protein
MGNGPGVGPGGPRPARTSPDRRSVSVRTAVLGSDPAPDPVRHPGDRLGGALRAPDLRPWTLWRKARRHKRARVREAEDARRLRYLALNWDHERPVLWLEGMLPPEEGVAVEAALRKRAQDVVGGSGCGRSPRGPAGRCPGGAGHRPGRRQASVDHPLLFTLAPEGGWRTSGHPAHDLRFHDPGGRPLRTRAPQAPTRGTVSVAAQAPST